MDGLDERPFRRQSCAHSAAPPERLFSSMAHAHRYLLLNSRKHKAPLRRILRLLRDISLFSPWTTSHLWECPSGFELAGLSPPTPDTRSNANILTMIFYMGIRSLGEATRSIRTLCIHSKLTACSYNLYMCGENPEHSKKSWLTHAYPQ